MAALNAHYSPKARNDYTPRGYWAQDRDYPPLSAPSEMPSPGAQEIKPAPRPVAAATQKRRTPISPKRKAPRPVAPTAVQPPSDGGLNLLANYMQGGNTYADRLTPWWDTADNAPIVAEVDRPSPTVSAQGPALTSAEVEKQKKTQGGGFFGALMQALLPAAATWGISRLFSDGGGGGGGSAPIQVGNMAPTVGFGKDWLTGNSVWTPEAAQSYANNFGQMAASGYNNILQNMAATYSNINSPRNQFINGVIGGIVQRQQEAKAQEAARLAAQAEAEKEQRTWTRNLVADVIKKDSRILNNPMGAQAAIEAARSGDPMAIALLPDISPTIEQLKADNLAMCKNLLDEYEANGGQWKDFPMQYKVPLVKAGMGPQDYYDTEQQLRIDLQNQHEQAAADLAVYNQTMANERQTKSFKQAEKMAKLTSSLAAGREKAAHERTVEERKRIEKLKLGEGSAAMSPPEEGRDPKNPTKILNKYTPQRVNPGGFSSSEDYLYREEKHPDGVSVRIPTQDSIDKYRARGGDINKLKVQIFIPPKNVREEVTDPTGEVKTIVKQTGGSGMWIAYDYKDYLEANTGEMNVPGAAQIAWTQMIRQFETPEKVAEVVKQENNDSLFGTMFDRASNALRGLFTAQEVITPSTAGQVFDYEEYAPTQGAAPGGLYPE